MSYDCMTVDRNNSSQYDYLICRTPQIKQENDKYISVKPSLVLELEVDIIS